MDLIRFGTDGWRSKITTTYNFPNVRRAAYGLGKALLQQKKSALVFVGYDTRFYSDQYCG